MKFTPVFLVLVALFATAFAARPTPPRRCDYRCTALDGNACASNGICLNNFPSQCQMEKYNCLFPKKSFDRVADWKCKERSLPICTLRDL